MTKVSMKTKDLTKVAIMSSLVCIATFFFKVPTPNGYAHLGDSMIFLAVLLLGWKKGAISGGIGAALADLIGGYAVWIIPTFFIKLIMASIMGLIIERLFPNLKHGWVLGATLGGTFQVLAYASVNLGLFGGAYAVSNLPADIIQTVTGIVIAVVAISVLMASNKFKQLKEI